MTPVAQESAEAECQQAPGRAWEIAESDLWYLVMKPRGGKKVWDEEMKGGSNTLTAPCEPSSSSPRFASGIRAQRMSVRVRFNPKIMGRAQQLADVGRLRAPTPMDQKEGWSTGKLGT